MSIYLHGLSTALPPHCLTQDNVKKRAEILFSKKYPQFQRLSKTFITAGIDERYSVVPFDWFEGEHGWTDRNEAYMNGAKALFITASQRSHVISRQDVLSLRFYSLLLRLAQYLFEQIACRKRILSLLSLKAANLTHDQIDRYVCHPGGAKVVEAIEDSLNLEANSLVVERDVLRDYGNMSAPTVLYVMKSVLESGATGQMMSCALGPGFSASFLPFTVTQDAA